MFARTLIEVLLVAVIVWEILIPLSRGLPLFPILRRKRQEKLLGELEHAKQDLVEDDIEEQVAKLREEHARRHPAEPAVEQEVPRKF